MTKFQCKMKCSYGNKGDIVELASSELTERQSVMLKPYSEPTVKKVEKPKSTKK